MAREVPEAAETNRGRVPRATGIGARLATLFAPGVPLAITAAIEIAKGWRPTSDDAAIAWRSYDVFTAHAPLLGAFNDASSAAHPVFDLGPLEYYLFAVPDRIDPVHGILWGSALLCAVLAGLAIEAAWRAGGQIAGTAVAAGFLVMTATQTGVVLNLPWNPNFGLFAFATTISLSVVVASGRTSWWPLAVFSGSLAADCHLIYAASAVAAVVVSSVLGLLARRRTGPSMRSAASSMACGLAVGILGSLPPLLQQIGGRQGNLSLLFDRLSHPGPRWGISHGLQAIGRSAGIWPAWTRPVPPVGSYVLDTRFLSELMLGRTGAGVVVISAAGAIGIVALATRRSGLGALGLIAAASAVCLAWTIGAISVSQMAVLTYVDGALWPLGLALDAAIGWGTVELAMSALRARRRRAAHGKARFAGLSPTVPALCMLSGLIAAGTWSITSLVPATSRSNAVIGGWAVVRAVAPLSGEIERQATRGPAILEPSVHLLPDGLDTWALTEGVAYQLKVSGMSISVLGPTGTQLGSDATAPRRAQVFLIGPSGRGGWQARKIAHRIRVLVFAWVS
ncbi:MAG: hypothetical protein ACYDBS_06190 [Acidimicrobiales bacterium]